MTKIQPNQVEEHADVEEKNVFLEQSRLRVFFFVFFSFFVPTERRVAVVVFCYCTRFPIIFSIEFIIVRPCVLDIEESNQELMACL